ncbi:hypothetical protein BDQ17DRAFT_1432049 [Cyathus striatus]|nr:hypothetical protein BDQ17DRAFT_1432049 [Cyathus striatus]
MSGLSSFFPRRTTNPASPSPPGATASPSAVGSPSPGAGPSSRTQSDPLADLRFSLEVMPGSRKYIFTPATRAEVLSKLYATFFGTPAHAQYFLPAGTQQVPANQLLSEVQKDSGYFGAGREEDDIITPGRGCGHVFSKGECCFRCKDCTQDETCAMCSRCFHATDHTGHNVSFFISQQPGGYCDCGDHEAWREPLPCPYHPPLSTEERLEESEMLLPRVVSPSTVIPVLPPPSRPNIPPLLIQSMSQAIAFALSYIIHHLSYSPDELTLPANEADLRLQPTADPMQKDHYNLVLWNDDKHSFDEVITLLCDLTAKPREEIAAVVDRIDDVGRDIIDFGFTPAASGAGRLLEIAQGIAQIDLGVTVRRAYDTFCEQIVGVMIEWLLDLTRSRLGNDKSIIREVLATELLAPRRWDISPYTSTSRDSFGNFSFGSSSRDMYSARDAAPSREPPVLPGGSRIDILFLYHTRLWKKPRLSLKELYGSVICINRAHRLAVASHFALSYPLIIDNYLLVDREAETSIKYFGLQLFTVPSVASHIVRHCQIITKLLNIITAFFTNQISDKHIIHPSSLALSASVASLNLPPANAPLDVESFPFKSKRFMPIFSDLRYLCHTAPVQELIAHNTEYILQFSKACQLFMCVNPNKRAASTHVEYETDAWISVFNVTLSLSRVIKAYGQAFARASVAELAAAISTVIHHILLVCALMDDRVDRTKFQPLAFHEVQFGGIGYQIVQFDVLDGWVSFHHSLHWLLAELFKHVDKLGPDALKSIGLADLKEFIFSYVNEHAMMGIMDFPLRVLAMVAQIRTGLWVRNGFAIRGQLLHYRDYMLRELCYDQDLYVLQTCLVIVNPNVVLVSILDRFGLTEYFAGDFVASKYEGSQLSSMVEEVLYVLITILSENGNAKQMSTPQSVRREIIHALAMGPCTFSDLVKRVAERLVDDVSFERMLKEVANFRAPESATDSGTYELKDEAYEEVNPFFYHYTRNKREEVENVLRSRLKKKTDVQDPVIVPKPFDVTHGPFADLPMIFESEVLLQVMFYSIYNVLVLTETSGATPPSAEAILDQALHLIMLALVERRESFSHLALRKYFPCPGDKNLVDVICGLEHHDKYKHYKSRVEWILETMEIHIPDDIRSRRRVFDMQPPAPSAEDAKKRAAKARQEAIMQQMKAQQASFAINFDDMDEEEDEDMEDASAEVTYGTCIVCQEDLNVNRPFGALGLLQPSRFIRRHPDSHQNYVNELLVAESSIDRHIPPNQGATIFPPSQEEILQSRNATTPNFSGFPAAYTRFGIYSSVCTHMMHLDCFQVYSVSIRQRHRAQATRNHPESIPRKEYICPLCKSLGNVILPVTNPLSITLNTTPFSDWIRAAGINILKSKPDQLLESLQFRNGTGEFVFWSAQDPGYATAVRERTENMEGAKMLDTVMAVSKSFSQQTRHLRDRPEPDTGERGAGIYLPEELVGYTISSLEIAQRGMEARDGLVVDNLSESQMRMIRGLLSCLTRLVALQFKGRPDEGREAVRQAIIKRLLPEWSRTSLTSFSYPLLLRDPFSVLVETAAVAPEMLRHVLILTYYACLARTVIGMVYILNKTRNQGTAPVLRRAHEDLFGDVRMFFMCVVRHSPVFEHTSKLVFETFGEARMEKLLYQFTLPFLRRAVILCRSVLPTAFSTPHFEPGDMCEYERLLQTLGIPPLSDLPNQEALQNSLWGWCDHYGNSHAASQLNCGVILDYPGVYRLAKLPLVLDSLFGYHDKLLVCQRCNTTPLDGAICLLCGATICFQSTCCKDMDYGDRGECNLHTRECGGTIGIYFLVKRCTILYLNSSNGTFSSSPYLDVHGEIDISMRRGRRQFLHSARWEEVRRTWLNHGIATVVARKLESSMDAGGWETM